MECKTNSWTEDDIYVMPSSEACKLLCVSTAGSDDAEVDRVGWWSGQATHHLW